ncbi:hypothetical protein [Methylobacterium sp. Leaf108]|uniref:COG3904 family protein n=1 Tax=Methylobacterium sp. Leaf108 TaxID=1736256 RepID=UPI0006F27560|nr:hypothetical protein [Methylobacterium sp. Leaf108]KQP51432.1 hypothetical protein ASF39_10435 [Methylobacterium sp. Leaf108]
MPITLSRPPRRPWAILCGATLLGAACLAAVASDGSGGGSTPRPIPASVATDLPDEVETDDAEPAARVTLGPGGRDLRLAGDLMEGVSARVAALLAENPGVRRIHLTSGGGLVSEGMSLGSLVAAHGLATYVPDDCASACTLVFVRGTRRYLGTGGRLGFHAPYETGPSGRSPVLDPAPERAAYRDAGIAADFVAEALAVASDDMWTPEPERLVRAGVVTDVVGTDRFPDSTLDDDDSPQAARTQVLRNLPILAGADPAAVDRIAAWYRDGYATGRTEADALDGLHRQAAAHLRAVLRGADEATVLAFGQAALAAMRQATDGSACEAIAGGDAVVIADTLGTLRPSGAGVAALIARARGQGGGRTAVAASEDGMRPPARPSTGACRAGTQALRRALARPLHQAASALRALLLAEPATLVAAK